MFRTVSTVLIGLLLGATAVEAQPRPSQHGTVSQMVADTDVSLGYDRPSARGRVLFGGIIEWDVVWTPGANRATWIEFSTPVEVAGEPLPAGRYGIWLYPHEADQWEVVLVSDWDTHHSFYPFETEVARVTAKPETASHVETLAFYFASVEGYEAELRMHWGETVLPLRIKAPE